MLDGIDADDGGTVAFRGGGDHLRVVDPLEGRQRSLRTDRPVDPTPVAVRDLRVPVDSAVRVDPGRLVFDSHLGVYVRDGDGQMLDDLVERGQHRVTGTGTRILEVNAEVKTYLVADPPVTVTYDGDRTVVDLAGPVVVGCRSRHTRPAVDLTVPPTPEGVMRALSLTGTALKTTGAERAWPSLRGHPPRIRLDEDLDQPVVPDGLAVPDTGITLYAPAEFDAVYPLAPLAFYLGADLRPGAPRLVTDAGHEYPLDHDGSVEATAERLLRQCLLFDCAVRMDGLYSFPLRERQAVEGLLEAPFADVYDRPTHEQVEAYLRVDPATVRPHLPRWEVVAHLPAEPTAAALLPYLLDDLAVVRTRPPSPPEGRGGSVPGGRTPEGPTATVVGDGPVERVWVGPGVPVGATRATVTAHENQWRERTTGPPTVTVVDNGTTGEEAREVERGYGAGDSPAEVRAREDLGVEQLAAVVRSGTEFLHFVGHADREGLHCHDGVLDVADVEGTDVEGFVLNACRTYDQGLALVEAGAVGGVVTMGSVAESGGVEMGETVVRLLGVGCQLRTALGVAREVSPFAGDYLVVGDGSYAFEVPHDGTQTILRLRRVGPESVGVRMIATLARSEGMGTVCRPCVDGESRHMLTPGRSPEYVLDPERFREQSSDADRPVVADGDLYLRVEGALDALLAGR